MKFNRLFLVSISLVTLLLAMPAQAQNSGPAMMTSDPDMFAVIDLVDPVFELYGNFTDDCTGSTSLGAAENAYLLTLTTAKRVTIDAQDCCCVGDY